MKGKEKLLLSLTILTATGLILTSAACDFDSGKQERIALCEAIADDCMSELDSIQRVHLSKQEDKFVVSMLGHYDEGFNHVKGYVEHKDYSIKYHVDQETFSELSKYISGDTIVRTLTEDGLKALITVPQNFAPVDAQELTEIQNGSHDSDEYYR